MHYECIGFSGQHSKSKSSCNLLIRHTVFSLILKGGFLTSFVLQYTKAPICFIRKLFQNLKDIISLASHKLFLCILKHLFKSYQYTMKFVVVAGQYRSHQEHFYIVPLLKFITSPSFFDLQCHCFLCSSLLSPPSYILKNNILTSSMSPGFYECL